jgi:hypothetical protein
MHLLKLAGNSKWQCLHPPREKRFWRFAHLSNMLASYKKKFAPRKKLDAASTA